MKQTPPGPRPARHPAVPGFFRRAFTLLFLAIAFGLLAPAAHAANITRTFSFVATNFSSGPETTVTGSITVTWDPAVSVTDQATGVTVNNLSVPYTGAALFTHEATTGALTIGANGSAGSISSGTNDFFLRISNAATAPTFFQFTYSRVGSGSNHSSFTATSFTVTIPDTISGGMFNEGRFHIGTTGTASDTNNWPANESPSKATDGDPSTKFLIFKGGDVGMIITPPSPATYNRLALTTANDAPERDPASYLIYGSTTALPTSGSFPIGDLTLIQEGDLALTDVRNNGTTVAGPAITQFNNTTAYASYLVLFGTVKSSPNLTQIAEVKLSQGLTVPHQVPVGKARGGVALTQTFGPGTVGTTNPGNNWPAGESPDHALDGSISSKYLLFRSNNASLIVSPEDGPAIVNSLSFWTADDAPERDPTSFQVYGSNAAISSFSYSGVLGTFIASGSTGLTTARNAGPFNVNFTNTTAYASYIVVFSAVRSAAGNNLTQISEVAFANVPTNAAPTNITLSATSIPENNAAGATIGTLTATDPDAGQTHTFSFGGGSLESIDNDAFTIEGNTLKLKNTADFETKSSYPVTIRATDNGSPPQYFDKTFTITITDVTIPQTIDFAPLADKTFGDPAFTVSATGGASGQPVTFSLVDADPALFRIQGNTVSMNGAGTVTVRASQAGSGDYSAATPVDRTFTVAKAPQTITFNPATTAQTTDTVTLSATGGGSGLPVTFDITNDGPGSISGNTLTFTGPGDVVVRASQAGNANYLAAADVDRTITVTDPVTAPVVTSPTSADITATSATLGGNVTSDGGSPITERGIVYALTSTNANPFIGGSGVTKVTASGTTGVFTVPVTGLTPGSGYSFKAYAISAAGELLGYTPAATFTTAAGETVTIGGTTVISAANIGANATVTELLTGQTIITGTVKSGELEDSIHFTLPPGKAVISGMLTVSDYVAAVAPPGQPIISNSLHYRSSSAFSTTSDTFTTTSVAVAAPTRCNTSTLSISIKAPLKVSQQFIPGPFGGFVPGPIMSASGSASYVLTLEIGDQQTGSTLGNLSGLNGTTLSPAFAPATTLYSATIPFSETYVSLTRTFSGLQYVTQSVNGGAATAIDSGDGTVFDMNVGLNTIVYRVCAQTGAETTYTVNITREPDPNAPPTFSGYAFTAAPYDWTEVATAKILARAADSDGGTLSITDVSNPSAQGNMVVMSGDNIRFAPANVSFRGLDTFTVTISDGQGGTVVGTVTVNVADPGQAQNQAQLSILPGGNVALLFQGIPGQEYLIERSTDLQNWSGLTTVTAAPDGTLPFTDTAPPSGAAFYRTALPNG